jgi:hypothetical protein
MEAVLAVHSGASLEALGNYFGRGTMPVHAKEGDYKAAPLLPASVRFPRPCGSSRLSDCQLAAISQVIELGQHDQRGLDRTSPRRRDLHLVSFCSRPNMVRIRPIQRVHQCLRQRPYPQPPPPTRRRMTSNTIAPTRALIIRATMPAPRWIFRRGSSQSPTSAPNKPTIKSPISPKPAPRITCPASQPAISPTATMISTLSFDRCMVRFSQNRKCRRLPEPNSAFPNMRKGSLCVPVRVLTLFER